MSCPKLTDGLTQLLPTRQAGKFLSPLNEMQMSTRQFTQSGEQAFSPLVRLVRLDSITQSLLPTRQAGKFLSPLKEMQMSTRQFTLSGGQELSPLVRLDYHTRGLLPTRQATKFLSPLNEMQTSTRRFSLSVDKQFLHSYGSYDSTIITRGLLHADKTSDKISKSP